MHAFPYGQSDTLFPLLVRFLIPDYFSVSDLSVRRDVSEFDKKLCVGTGDVPNALEEASTFVAKAVFPKGMETGILHECHVFHFFPGDGVDDGVCLPGRWACVQCTFHRSRFWDKLRGESLRERVGTLGGDGCSVLGVTTLGGNGAFAMSCV
jgi:hypothetical protein